MKRARLMLILCVPVLAVFIAAGAAWAGGIMLYQFGSPDVGLAAAGYAARAQDAATVFTNPAGMSRLEKSQVLGGVQALCGNVKFSPNSATTVSCGDIEFDMVDVSFGNLKDKAERDWMAKLPTSFRLSGEQVDRLRAGARKILTESDDFKRLLRDLGAGSLSKGSLP